MKQTAPPAPPTDAGPNPVDGRALLRRFAADRDQAAFAELVGRYGPMVFGVCRRVLADAHDAEDAFQATFLLLARDAGRAVARGAPVEVWLYGAAYRVATHARRAAARRQARDRRQATPMTPTTDDPALEIARRDLIAVLDAELHELPDRLREPLVLCYLGEQTHDQAAEQLGVHPRSLERRLAAALAALQKRLGRRGVVLSVPALVAALSQQAVAVPPALAVATAKAGAATGTAALAVGVGGLSAVAWVGVGVGLGLVLVAGTVGLMRGLGGNSGASAVAGDTTAVRGEPAAAPEPPPEQPPVGRRHPFVVRGRVVDAADRPAAGATVLLLSRPVRRLPGGQVEPLHDPLATQKFRTGVFRELARGTTGADGRFVLSAEQTVPDPTTGAVWFQSLPAVVKGARGLRIESSEGEFGNMIWLPGVGIP